MGKHRAAGFTLIELLVVLFIAALLASITLPVFMNMRRTGRHNTCTQNLREIGAALELYHDDYGCYPAPPGRSYLQAPNWQDLPYSSPRTWQIDGAPSATSIHVTETYDLIDTATATSKVDGMIVLLRPTAAWSILSAPSSYSLQMASVANLKAGMAVTLTDSAGASERWAVDDVDVVNKVVSVRTDIRHPALTGDYTAGGTLTATLPGEKRAIGTVDAAGVITFADLTYDYSNGGVVSIEPAPAIVRDSDSLPANQLSLSSVAGFEPGLRLTVYDAKPAPGLSPAILDQPQIEAVDSAANVLTFTADLRRDAYDPQDGKTVYLTWAVGNFGLASMYQQYLADRHNYLRSYQRFHCPSDTVGETKDRNEILAALQAAAPATEQFHAFDPLFGGYNSYDLTYNYDQYEGLIKTFDADLGYNGSRANVLRQLKNPTAPADTVVCWCSYHANGGETPSGWAPNTVINLDEYERQQSDMANLVLWADGAVKSVRPYLTRDKDGKGYWVPLMLVTRGEAKR